MRLQWLTLIACAIGLAACGADTSSENEQSPASKAPVSALAPSSFSQAPTNRPNILLIVADDLGFAELGAYGGEINTPNLDALAKTGMIFTDYYVAPACSPTRAMLMSGVDSHRAGLGTMEEAVSGRIPTPAGIPDAILRLSDMQRGLPGYEGHLNDRVHAFPALLREANYRTLMAGKWHLGIEEPYWPFRRGFEKSFALLEGAASHFSDGWRSVAPLQPALYVEDDQPTELPDNFYSSRTYVDLLIRWLGQSTPEDTSPFFAYLALTAPHDPLHLPDDLLAQYAGAYADGYEVLQQRRLERQKEQGLFADGVSAFPFPQSIPAWETLSEEDKARSSRSMEIYAAMVEEMDAQIGRLLTHLKDIGEYDNTYVFFMSDNGPAASTLKYYGFDGDEFDNTLENMGQAGSFVSYGPGWALAGSTPLRMYKGYAFEGGVRAPLIVSGPSVVSEETSNAFIHVTDIAPTLLEIAGVTTPTDPSKITMTGKPMTSILNGAESTVRADSDAVGWELFGSSGLREGDWKITYHRPHNTQQKGRWLLFNLKDDPSEKNDLSEHNPDKKEEMLLAWAEYVEENNVVLLPDVMRKPD